MQRGEKSTLITSFTFNPSWMESAEDEQNIYFTDPITKLLNNTAISYISCCIENQVLSGLLITSPSRIYSINAMTGRLVKLSLQKQLGDESIDPHNTHLPVWSVDTTYSAHSVIGMKTVLSTTDYLTSGK